MNFDITVDRRNTHSKKWDMMEQLYGVSADDGLSMWVADMDFHPPKCVSEALKKQHDGGVFGYYGDDAEYIEAIQWWMKTRHNWEVSKEAIFTTHGLVNGTSMCMESFTKPGDGVVLFTPVYHSFARVIRANNREVIEMPMVNNAGRYELDFDAYDAMMPDNAKVLIMCSPHNPSGRVWTKDELHDVADFAKRHDLLLISDEIHHDLTFGTPHTPMAHIEGIEDRLVMMTSTGKTFNLAGGNVGNVIIENPELREKFAGRMEAMGMAFNSFGLIMATAAYSSEGAVWVDALRDYLNGNRKIMDEGLNAIPGVKSMKLDATYLSWVDFTDTGMPRQEVIRRVQEGAKIAANYGPTFGTGGENFLRFNFATSRSNIVEAVSRMQKAFADMQ